MDYSTQGSRDSYSSQAHNLYPYPQPSVYPPPPAPGSHGYQSYLGEENPPYGWPEQPPPPPAHGHGPYPYGYQEDPDCLTFLRGCFAGLCCCCLLGQCCY